MFVFFCENEFEGGGAERRCVRRRARVARHITLRRGELRRRRRDLARAQRSRLPPRHPAWVSLPPLTPANIGGYAFLCLVGTALAYCVYFHGLSKLPPAVIASLGPLSPVTAFILGWIFLGQSMTPLSMLGFVLVIASILGVQRAMMGARKAALSHTK